MRYVLMVLAAMVALEALTFVVFPDVAKRAVEALTPNELRIAGVLELAIAGAAFYFALAG